MRKGAAPADFDLARFLPYLINRAGVRLAVAFAEDIAPHGVTLQEWRVLAALVAHGPQRLGELARLTSIDVSTLSRLIGRMARQRLVGRTRDNGDRRAVRLALAAKGRSTAHAIIPLARRYERAALAGFDEVEGDRLRGMLDRVYRNLDALVP